jgi:transglutaminase-like putative cysteine protease
MRFSLTHKTCSYLMVLAAFAAVVLSNALEPWVALAALVGLLTSWFAEPPRFAVGRYTTAWNIAALLVLVYLVVRIVQGSEVIIAGVGFLLFVLINKLFNRRSSKDYQQAYVVSFLLMIATTTLNTGLSYAVCFVLYTIFGTWSLVLLHLRREMEQNYLLQHTAEGERSEKVEVERILSSRRIIGPGFLAGTSVLSLGMLIGAVLIFTLFPRIGFGLFSGPKRRGIAMVGFSDEVKLGHHGRLRDNRQVVMRVRFGTAEQRVAPPAGLRWRGKAFDRYEAGAWRHSDDLVGRSAVVTPNAGLYVLNDAPGIPASSTPQQIVAQTLRQEIYLEPLETSVIFAADRPVAVRLPALELGQKRPFVPRRGPLGEIRATARKASGVHYIAYSKPVQIAPARLRAAEPLPAAERARYLQLPANLPARVRALAQRVTAGRRTIYDKARAVEAYLQRNYAYTVELTHERRRDPVDEFLFETRRGHCEYFASALAILLRAAGVHARHVNGFVGGRWNDYGRFLAVAQRDAHAWTEVFFPQVGWVAFDATPARGRPSPPAGGVFDGLEEFVDALRMRWFSYVVEYDLSRQIELVERARNALRGRSSASQRDTLRDWARQRRWYLVASGLIIVLALVGRALWRRWQRRRGATYGAGISSRGSGPHPAARSYLRMLRLLEREGLVKSTEQTPAEFARQLADTGHREAALVDQITAAYYAQRFGARSASPPDLSELTGQLKQRLLRS